jgi:hypothetical protein
MLLLLGTLALPTWAVVSQDQRSFTLAVGLLVAGWVLGGLSLMIIPVRVARRRRVERKSIWLPILGSGLLMGALFYGGGIALDELFHEDKGNVEVVLFVALSVWFLWTIIFIPIAVSVDPDSLGMKLHRLLIGGSVLELLVAVPTHLVVRQRNYCCAGLATGMGMAIGVAVMIVSFGPAVFLLYYRRWRQILR